MRTWNGERRRSLPNRIVWLRHITLAAGSVYVRFYSSRPPVVLWRENYEVFTPLFQCSEACTWPVHAAHLQRGVDMAIAKRVAADSATINVHLAEADKLSTTYPGVFSWLTDATYADGSPRTPGSMTVFCALEGGLRACLNDKDTEEVAFVSANNMSTLLKRVSEGVETGALDWRKSGRGGKAKRVK